MTIQIREVGVTVPGQVVRKHDKTADETTLVLNEVQLREIIDSAKLALGLLGAATPESPTQVVETPAVSRRPGESHE